MRREETSIPNTEFVTATGNFDTQRQPIDRIVIHTTVGTLQSAINTFGKRGTQVSAHYIVDLDGKLYQGLEEYFTAYHSGNLAMNRRSIGIEHVDNGKYTAPRTDALYETSSRLVADICKFYSIPCDRAHILKHNEVSATGCPHNLDIDRIVRQANLILNPNPDCQTKLKEMTAKYEEKEKLETFLRGEIEKKDIEISNQMKTINNLNGQIADLEKEKNRLADDLSKCQLVAKEHEGCQFKIIEATNLKNQAEQDYAKAKGEWQLKEIEYNKRIKFLETKLSSYKMPVKNLLSDIWMKVVKGI